jgi:hypothetical protein
LSLENTIIPEDLTYTPSETTLISKEEWVNYSLKLLEVNTNNFSPIEKNLPLMDLVEKLAPTAYCDRPVGLFKGHQFWVQTAKFISEQEVLDFKNTYLQEPWVLNNIYQVEYSNKYTYDTKTYELVEVETNNSKNNFIMLRFALLPPL